MSEVETKEEYIIISKEHALRMLTLFGDIETELDENRTIKPDASAAKGWGSDHATKDQLAKDEYSIHQKVSWMVSGYGCYINDHKPDWEI